VDFIEEENRCGFKLPYHIAEKSIPFLDENGNLAKSENKNGIKFETFVFDALLDTKRSVSVEIERKREFSPLKNKNGLDSIDTVKKDLLANYARWFKKAGFNIPADETGCPPYDIEISPTFALDLAEFLERKNDITHPEPGLYLE
jgi:UDP-N-acetylglucosamine/UDP-N-acetylgalactosamine diphosphorylase